jgi:hypothetical protein
MNFSNFLSDMGECPESLSIDRKDNNLGYSKNNCRWAAKSTQANNKRTSCVISYKGNQMTISELAEKHKIPYHKFWQRIKRLGWSVDEALEP